MPGKLSDYPVWEWVRHGNGWALMQGQHITFADGSAVHHVHGFNKLTVADDGFDWGGEELRATIARLLNEEAGRT